jgi:mannose-6-phosphate isomerase-like protein (cupin superfamily)
MESRRVSAAKSYLEFLRTPTLSLGLYVLHACEQDLQQPHSEDEVYYVIQGRVRFTAGEVESPVQSGSILFVEAGVKHCFHQIEEDLKVLVFLAPPDGTHAG